MTWLVKYTSHAQKDLRNLDRRDATRVNTAIQRFATEGRGDVKRIQGQYQLWRLRAGNYRVLFTFNITDHAMIVLRVRHRREAYRP